MKWTQELSDDASRRIGCGGIFAVFAIMLSIHLNSYDSARDSNKGYSSSRSSYVAEEEAADQDEDTLTMKDWYEYRYSVRVDMCEKFIISSLEIHGQEWRIKGNDHLEVAAKVLEANISEAGADRNFDEWSLTDAANLVSKLLAEEGIEPFVWMFPEKK